MTFPYSPYSYIRVACDFLSLSPFLPHTRTHTLSLSLGCASIHHAVDTHPEHADLSTNYPAKSYRKLISEAKSAKALAQSSVASRPELVSSADTIETADLPPQAPQNYNLASSSSSSSSSSGQKQLNAGGVEGKSRKRKSHEMNEATQGGAERRKRATLSAEDRERIRAEKV